MTLLDESTRLSTQPEAPRPKGRRFVQVRYAWRQLTSMRTALLLLFLLALASVPGGFIPQRPRNPVLVRDYIAAHPTISPAMDRLGLFDVFASPWFAAVYLLLFVSLIGCLGPRIRLHARALRTAPPKLPARLDRLPANDRWETDLSPEQAAEAVRKALNAQRWRTVARENGVSAEKGYLRETGNLLFHVSLVVLLIAIAAGSLYGFKGSVLVKEGDAFASTALSYDDVQPGRRFSSGSLVPFNFTLDSFNATYTDKGEASTFDAQIDWKANPDAPSQKYDVRVNHPLVVGAAKLYLIGHGYAPHVIVKDGQGNVALDTTVPCLPQGVTFLSDCTIKAPNVAARGEQLGFQGAFTPTTALNPKLGVTSVFPGLRAPGLTIAAFRGDLGLDSGASQSVYELDKGSLAQVGVSPTIFVGDTWKIPGGGSIQMVGVDTWATFQVTQDPGKGLALLASIGIVGGLLLSLSIRRRRLWARVRKDSSSGRTVVEIGGLARTNAEAFAAEFETISERLRSRTDGPAPA